MAISEKREIPISVTARRVLAYIVDMILATALSATLLLAGPRFDPDYLLRPSIHMFSAWGTFAGVIVAVIGLVFRNLICGKTSLGKRLFGLRVDAAPAPDAPNTRPTAEAVIQRNLPALYPIAFMDFIFLLVQIGVSFGDTLSKTRAIRKPKY